jgi:Zn-dependent protease
MGFIVRALIAIALHEVAHLLVALSLGVRIKQLGVGWKGPFIVREYGMPSANLCVALAGPVLNLILAVAYWNSARQFALINLVLGGSNLLPFVPGGDGQHALSAFRSLKPPV